MTFFKDSLEIGKRTLQKWLSDTFHNETRCIVKHSIRKSY